MENARVTVLTAGGKRVSAIELRLVMHDMTGTQWVTDMLLQAGKRTTLWVGHPAEIQWSLDS